MSGADSAPALAAGPPPALVRGESVHPLMIASLVYLQFEIDRATHQVVVSVINQDTGQVIRQIPPEVQLALAAYFRDVTGTLLNRNG
ncbi:flagellar protein FlaG [Nitrospira sp. Kam-Ns4a]